MPRADYRFFGTGLNNEGREDFDEVLQNDTQGRDEPISDQSYEDQMEVDEEEDVEEEVEEGEEHDDIDESNNSYEDEMTDEENDESLATEVTDGVNVRDTVQSLLSGCSSTVLCAILGGALARESTIGFNRRADLLPPDEMQQAKYIFSFNKYSTSSLFFCNGCGKRVEKTKPCVCGGAIAKYIRLPVKDQIESIVRFNFARIRKVREMMTSGIGGEHNLSFPFFRQMWESEPDGSYYLSLLASIDGVSLHGHTKKKIWPISFALVDLPSAAMQKAENICLGGIIECIEDPSTALWNSLLEIVFLDIETVQFVVDNVTCKSFIVTFVADQPAKRKLFGMRGHNSSCSCFFCLDEGTFYKWISEARHLYRPEQFTRDDARNRVNGFGKVYPEVLQYVMPYDTPVDVLHNCGEGLLDVILKEALPPQQNWDRKTDLFLCSKAEMESHLKRVPMRSDYRKCVSRRNGSTKQDFFRSFFLEACLCTDLLNSRARIIIIGLAMIMQKMYTGAESNDSFVNDVCTSLQEFFRDEYHKYLSMKAHELLCHLPYVFEKFGNPAYLSTFMFESFYKFVLSDYNTCITNNFCETASTRFMIHACSRREILSRFATAGCCPRIQQFLTDTPHLLPKKVSYKSRVQKLNAEDKITDTSVNSTCFQYFSVLSHPAGTLVSTYYKATTKDDIVFLKNCNGVKCARFVAFVVCGSERKLIVQPVEEIPQNLQFQSLNRLADDFNDVTKLHCRRILRHLKEFNGILHGTMSNQRILVSEGSVQGVGVKFNSGTDSYFVQLNGLPVHA